MAMIVDYPSPFDRHIENLNSLVRLYCSAMKESTGWSEEESQTAATAELRKKARIGYEAAVIARVMKHSYVIEVGCGQALPAICAAYQGARVIAADPKGKAIEAGVLWAVKFNVRLQFRELSLQELVEERVITGNQTLIADMPNGFEDDVFQTAIRTGCSLVYSPPFTSLIRQPYESALPLERKRLETQLSKYGHLMERNGFQVATTIGKGEFPRGILTAVKSSIYFN